jgi:hypothetical protein
MALSPFLTRVKNHIYNNRYSYLLLEIVLLSFAYTLYTNLTGSDADNKLEHDKSTIIIFIITCITILYLFITLTIHYVKNTF